MIGTAADVGLAVADAARVQRSARDLAVGAGSTVTVAVAVLVVMAAQGAAIVPLGSGAVLAGGFFAHAFLCLARLARASGRSSAALRDLRARALRSLLLATAVVLVATAIAVIVR